MDYPEQCEKQKAYAAFRRQYRIDHPAIPTSQLEPKKEVAPDARTDTETQPA